MTRKRQPYIPYVTGRTQPKRYTKRNSKPYRKARQAAPLGESVQYLALYGRRAINKTLKWGHRGHRVITAPIKFSHMMYRGLRRR